MSDIRVTLKDGTVKHWPHTPRAGGSYANHIRYEGAFAVITDVWGNTTAIPAADIQQVETQPLRYG